MLEVLWSKLPGILKWPLLLGAILILLPIKIYEGAKDFVHSEVQAYVVPIEDKREVQMYQIRNDIQAIKQDTRDIKNILMSRGVDK